MSIIRKGTPKWRVHPGEILREELLKPMGMSVYRLAKRLCSSPRMNDIVLEKRSITADSGFQFPRFPFGRGQRAIITVEIPPRGRKSPFTSAHTGRAHRTTSSNTRLTMFS